MKNHHGVADQKGYSLVTIVVLFTLLAVMATGAASLNFKLQAVGKNNRSVDEMFFIRDALQKYYRGHQEEFPLLVIPILTTHILPSDSGGNRIPVQSLNLEQKFRYDAWGQFYHYDPGSDTDITDISVDGKAVAAVIISSGPDQVFQSGNSSPYTTQGDDILVPINLREQAIEITLMEMRVLQKKLRAYALRLCSTASTQSTAANWIIPSNPSGNNLFTLYELGDQYKEDAWLEGYIISNSGIRSSGPDKIGGNSDDLFLSKLDVTCPGGLTPLPLAIAGGGFNENSGSTTYMGEGIGYQGLDPLQPNKWLVDIDGSVWSVDTPDGSVSCLDFDGAGAHLDLGSPSLLDPGTGDYAIGAWIKVDAVSAGKRVIYATSHSSDQTAIEFSVLNNGHLNFRLVDGDGDSIEAEGSISVTEYSPEEYWCHVVAVWENASQEIKLYLNGKEDTASLNALGDVGALVSDRSYYIGQDQFGNGFSGLIDEVSIYNAAISAGDVKNIYNASAVGGFSFKYSLNGEATDISWHGNTGIIYGNPLLLPDKFGNPDSAYLFDGVDDYVICDISDWKAINGYSVMVWAKAADINQPLYSSVFNNYNTNAGNLTQSFQIDFDNSNPKNYRIFFENSPTDASEFGLVTNNWQLLAVTHGGLNVITYYDGLANLPPYTTQASHAADNIDFRFYTVGRNRSQNAYFNGTVSKISIFARVLSPREVLNEQNAIE